MTPPDKTKPKYKPATVGDYFDTNHAHDLDTSSYASDTIVFLNYNPVQSYLKSQGTMDIFTYVPELLSGIISTELVISLR